ncbi:MAG TPA: OmpA family protein [Roseobacter sp.]|uniref:OmpA-like domain-containing protein n=1 Tax=marine sediment metagenome TaxID=412755 RepID=A0A0F9NZ31_9ZZZZ|nr:OmpA family protein [Roseobacter sp.]
MYRVLKSTTSLTMCVALALPVGAFAQPVSDPQASAEFCIEEGTQPDFPCSLPDGTEVLDAEQLNTLREDGTVAEAFRAEAARTAGIVNAETQATAEAQALARARVAAAAAAEAAAADAQAATDKAASDAEAAVQAAAAKAAETQAAADAKAAEAQAAMDAEAQAEADREAAVAAQIEADAQARQSAEASAQSEANATAPSGQAEADPTAAQVEADLAAQQAAEQARSEQRAAEAAAAAAAAAAADSGEAKADVVTEEITAEDTRSSNQEFSTTLNSQTNATTTADAPAKEDDGMSKFEKALLLGLGAVAVGAVLNNGSKVMSNSGDRLVVQDPNGDLRVLKDDAALLRQSGDEVRRETFNDGSSRTTVVKPDGSKVVTILGRDGTVLRRINVDPQGNEFVLFDDTRAEENVVVNELPQVEHHNTLASQQDEEALRTALATQLRDNHTQRFSLRQVRDIRQVRALAPEVELDALRFATGSAAIQPEQARALAKIGSAISNAVHNDPRTVILIEGHTDAVGDAGYNLALSDRRAETVALALTEYFDVPPANLITQGYGESNLKVPTVTAEPANRRAVVRNITGLLRQ